MPGFWIFRVAQGLPIAVNLEGFWICVGMQLCKGSEYSRIPNMAGFSNVNITQGSDYAWIWLFNAWINCSDYGRIMSISR